MNKRTWIVEVWRVWWQRRWSPGLKHERLLADFTGFEHFMLCLQASAALLLQREAKELYAHEAWDWGTELAWAGRGTYLVDGMVGHAFDALRVRGFSYLIQSDGTL